jgi:3-hydroxyisobutyrate dehydrogenase-like beta-hydroxyacid dehydrogenase
MGNKAVLCGEAGAGQSVKICNNMILGVTMIATCESIALGDKLGLDREKLFEVLSTSSGASWTVNTYFPAPDVGPKSPADNNYEPGFAAELMVKDLGLSQEAAEDVMPTRQWAPPLWHFIKNLLKMKMVWGAIFQPCYLVFHPATAAKFCLKKGK